MSDACEMNQQEQWLKKVMAMESTDFQFKLCKGTPSGAPGKWIPWEDWDWTESPRAEFRTLCQNELLLDLDIDDKDELYFTALLLRERFKEYNIPFYLYDSGGKGLHFQVWLGVPNPDEVDWKAIRNRVVRVIGKNITYRAKIGHFWRWNLDPRKWNWDHNGAGSVVRTVGGKKKRVKFMIDEIVPPIDRKRITRPRFPNDDFEFKVWELPEWLVVEYSETKDLPTFSIDSFLEHAEIPMCIENLIEQQEYGFHSNHMQRLAIVAYLWKSWKSKNKDVKMKQPDFDEIHKIFVRDPEYREGTTNYQIKNIIATLENNPYKVPRCKYLRSEGLVDTELCEICRMVR